MSTRVSGHGLMHEGRPVVVAGCCSLTSGANHGQRNYYDQHGHGICSCGEIGPHETTSAARQRWHREHKAAVVASSSLANGAVGSGE